MYITSYKDKNNSLLKKLTIKDVFLFVASASFFMPAGYAVSHTTLTIWRLVVLVVSLISTLAFFTKCRIKMSWAGIQFSIIAYYLLSKYINKSDGDTNLSIFYTLYVSGYISFLEYAFSSDLKRSLRIYLYAGIMMCAVHYATFLLYRHVPGGMRGYYIGAPREALERGTWFFFKHDNGSAFFFLPMLALLWYYVCQYHSLFKITLIFSFASLYMYWSQWSVAAMIVTTSAVVIFTIVYAYNDIKIFSVFSTGQSLVIGWLLPALFVLFICGGSAIPQWANFLAKSTSFNSRNRIWTRSIEFICSNILFGVGYELDATSILRLSYNHCHNIILQILYTGGVFTLVPMLLSMFGVVKPFGIDSRISKGCLILNVTIVLLFLLSSFDWYLYIPIPFSVLILLKYSD